MSQYKTQKIVISSRLLSMAILLLVPTCIVSCSRDETPTSETMPVVVDSDTASEDPAVVYANRVTKTDSAYREGYFEHEGLRLHYVEAGEGDLIILYHGFPSYWLSFLDQMEALKPQYRVVAVDGLGAGLSDKPDTLSAYRVEALAAQLDGLARHLAGDEKFTLIGHDWGGALALTFAEAYPDRLKGVVGMSAPSYNVFLDLLKSSEEQQAASSYMQRIRETPPEAVVEDPPGERLWRMGYGKLVEFGVLSEEEGELFRQALAPAEATNGGFNWYRANTRPTCEDQAASAIDYRWRRYDVHTRLCRHDGSDGGRSHRRNSSGHRSLDLDAGPQQEHAGDSGFSRRSEIRRIELYPSDKKSTLLERLNAIEFPNG
jgi:pimeloyl-ACP methyl ester carboxylesterase